LAFDLTPEIFNPILKAYLFPYRQALLTKTSPSTIVFSTIRKLELRESPEPGRALFPALRKIEDFVAPRDGGFESTRRQNGA
jgi:hypothetical protein